jgi:hypothetical protein
MEVGGPEYRIDVCEYVSGVLGEVGEAVILEGKFSHFWLLSRSSAQQTPPRRRLPAERRGGVVRVPGRGAPAYYVIPLEQAWISRDFNARAGISFFGKTRPPSAAARDRKAFPRLNATMGIEFLLKAQPRSPRDSHNPVLWNHAAKARRLQGLPI